MKLRKFILGPCLEELPEVFALRVGHVRWLLASVGKLLCFLVAISTESTKLILLLGSLLLLI